MAAENYLSKIMCECGQTHSFSSPVYESCDLERVLKGLSPEGTHILFAGVSQALRRRLGKLYRITQVIPKKSGTITNKEEVDERAEDIRLVVSDGEGSDLGKYIAQKLGLRHVTVGAGDMSSYAHIGIRGAPAIKKCAPPIIVADDTEMDLPRSFAAVMLSALKIFDYSASRTMTGESVCPLVFSETKRVCSMLLKTSKKYSKASSVFRDAILEARIKISALSEYLNDASLVVCGASQAAAALALLLRHEQRPSKSFEENAFLFAPIVAAAYAAFLRQAIWFSPPPNSLLRTARLNEYLGLPFCRAIKQLTPYPSRHDAELTAYRLERNRDLLKAQIADAYLILNESRSIFLGLYPDDGFWTTSYVDSLDLSLCVGLGANVLPAPTLLSHMTSRGILDKLIL